MKRESFLSQLLGFAVFFVCAFGLMIYLAARDWKRERKANTDAEGVL